MSAQLHRVSHWTITEGEGAEKTIRLVAPFDQLDASELAVLRWLLWRMHEKTGLCIPSDDDIAAGNGLSTKTVGRARQRLKRKGLIDWTPRYVAGKRTSNSYVLTDKLSGRLRELQRDRAGATDGQSVPPPTDTLSHEREHGNVGALEDVGVGGAYKERLCG